MSLAISVQQGHQTHISAIDANVTLQSCDEKQFKVNMHDLQTYSAGFRAPSPTQFKLDDVVKMLEPSSVIELLLQYMKPGPQPDLSKVDFKDLAGLAEVAQKYEVWSAMEVTKLQMQNCVPKHGFDVLVFASKHNFVAMADAAAEYSCRAPLNKLLNLNAKYLNAFTLYLDQHRLLMDNIHDWPNYHVTDGLQSSCILWSYTFADVMADLRNVSGPKEILKTFEVDQEMYLSGGEELRACPNCYQDMSEWRAKTAKALQATQPLHTFFGE